MLNILSKQKKQIDLNSKELESALIYIKDYWSKLERNHTQDDSTLVGLPYSYLVPSVDPTQPFSFNEMYYWDSYFMVQAMLDIDHLELVKGILENLLTLMQRFKVVPNASRTYFTGRSQPPFLTSFIMDVHKLAKDPIWLEKAMAIAKEEYENVWMGQAQPNWRQVYGGLSRYYDVNVLHDLAEAESGWDMTTRFSRKALNYLPVDLNTLLYKYEVDFAESADILGNARQAEDWRLRAQTRKNIMNELMWSKTFNLYFDYNYKKERRGSVASLASYYPMWAGMASDQQAKQLVKSLRKFEHIGGLATTDRSTFLPNITIPAQWAYPNGWAPLHFIVVEGLKRYGYHEDAERIARKWLKTNLDWYIKNNVFLEKYNVVNPKKMPVEGVYPTQMGYGWTNAIFERFYQDFIQNK